MGEGEGEGLGVVRFAFRFLAKVLFESLGFRVKDSVSYQDPDPKP